MNDEFTTKQIREIIQFLNSIKEEELIFYCFLPTLEGLVTFLSGFSKACFITIKQINFENFLNARIESISQLGWKVSSANPYREMQEREMSEKEIITALIEIEIKTWEILKKTNL